MADKEIIIDGVDVSGCCQYMPRYMEDYDIDTLDYCRHHFKPCKDVDIKYCYFKQLKRKEQECEGLKEDRERWKSNFNGKVSAIEELLQQLNQLKTKNIKIYKTLTEIKEIAEEQIPYLNIDKAKIIIEAEYDYADKICNLEQRMYKILQKISEVENDR